MNQYKVKNILIGIELSLEDEENDLGNFYHSDIKIFHELFKIQILKLKQKDFIGQDKINALFKRMSVIEEKFNTLRKIKAREITGISQPLTKLESNVLFPTIFKSQVKTDLLEELQKIKDQDIIKSFKKFNFNEEDIELISSSNHFRV